LVDRYARSSIYPFATPINPAFFSLCPSVHTFIVILNLVLVLVYAMASWVMDIDGNAGVVLSSIASDEFSLDTYQCVFVHPIRASIVLGREMLCG
jgi:hypothetical protein